MQKPRFLAFPSLLALGLVVAPACADDAVALDEGSTSSEVSTSSEAEAEVGAEAEAEVGAEAEAEVDTGEATETTGMNMHPDPEGMEPVRGLQIAGVTANQAVTIAIANGTSWNDGNNRNASLVPGRRTLVRVWRTVDQGWVPREVHCRLELYLENGESRDYWSVLQNVSGDTQALDLSTSCNFLLDEEDAETSKGTTFQVSVWEPIGNGAGLTEHNTVSPADGPGLIGFEAFPMEMKMRMVKFEYQGQTPPIQENLQAFHDALLEQDPLQRVIIDVREEPAILENPTLNAMTAVLSQLRMVDGADWNQYYYGLVDTGQSSGTVGLAGLGGITGAGLWLNSISATADTFVHEVGHNLNMSHVECPAGFGMPPYANYPHAGGKIGVPGYGILSGQMYDPTVYYNYMTYCGPTWTSDWNFNQAWFRIYSATNDPPPIPKWPTIPGWPDDPMPHWVPEAEIPILRGMIGSDGFEDWWTGVDRVDPELLSGTQRFRFHQDGVLIAEVLGEVRVMPDDNSLWVSVPLTQNIDLDSVVITRESAGVVHEVPLRQEKQLHKIVLARHGISAAPLPSMPGKPGTP